MQALRLPLLLLVTALGAAPATAQTSPSELQASIDAGLRWVRAQQADDGSYGDAVSTARALYAFAEGPREYRAGDGPFIDRALLYLASRLQPDGSIAAPDRNEVVATQETLEALQAVGASRHGEVIERMTAFLMAKGVRLREFPFASSLSDAPVDLLENMVQPVLQSRNEDGSFGKGAMRLSETLGAIRVLSALHAALLARETPAAAPGEAQALPPISKADQDQLEAGLRRGAQFLLAAATETGRWGFPGQADPGITAMVVGALLEVPEPRGADTDAAIGAALDWLVSLQKEDGSIHAGQLANYVTSASLLALVKAKRPGDAEVVKRGRMFLQVLQSDEGEGYSSEDRYYGGVGYGGDERPDLSNLQMALEALAASGLPGEDDSFQKALVFLQRCQNRSETNDLVFEREGTTYASGNDGGAGYAPGESKAGTITLADGRKVTRSYGSMTYALLKSYLFAGLPREDPRVEAAWKWLKANYTLDVNPGFEASEDPTAAYQGLFYYFYTMARALALFGSASVIDAHGIEHDWRAELSGRILAMQRQDGSWINVNAERWFEGNPVLASAYAMLTLGEILVN